MAKGKTVQLSKYNPSFTIQEKNGHASIRIIKLVSTSGMDLISHSTLRLEVIDQHGLPLWSKPIAEYQEEEIDFEIAVLFE